MSMFLVTTTTNTQTICSIAFLDPQNAPKSLAAGASPQTPSLDSMGPTSKGRGRRVGGREGRGVIGGFRGGGKGAMPPKKPKVAP